MLRREPALNAEMLGQLIALQQRVRDATAQSSPLTVSEILHWPGMLGDDTN